MTLTPKQSAFVDEYLLDLNGTQAAVRAGYAKKNAHVTAARLLSNAKVKPLLQAAMKARSRRTQVASDWVLKRLHDQAEADLADIYEKDGRLKAVHEWPEIWRSGLVASVETRPVWIGPSFPCLSAGLDSPRYRACSPSRRLCGCLPRGS